MNSSEATQRKLPSYSASAVAGHNSLSDAWVIYGEKVFDVTKFLSLHPGGEEITLEHLGKDVTDVLNSEILHAHSANAIQLLKQYCIGELEQEDRKVRLEYYIIPLILCIFSLM